MVGGEELVSSSSPRGSDKVKLVCSHGGKILPRPFDGTLRYVGGETRVVSVARSITFQDLMKKINNVFDGEYVIKYQIAMEDLDSLVSIKTDEDIRHMLDEYDRLEQEGTSKLRAYLFQAKSTSNDIHNSFSSFGPHPHPIDQRYIDAINGIFHPSNLKPKSILQNASQIKSFSPSPTESPQSISPHSPMLQDNSLINNLQNKLAHIHKVQSSPNLCNLGCPRQNNNMCKPSFGYYCLSQHQHYYRNGCQQSSPHFVQIEDHIHVQQSYQPLKKQLLDIHNHHYHGYNSPTSPQKPLMAVMDDSLNGPCINYGISTHPNKNYQYPFLRGYPGSGGHKRWGHLEQK